MSNCPECNSAETAVKDSRPAIHLNTIVTRRRRICLSCTERYTTYEVSKKILEQCGFVVDGESDIYKAHEVHKLLSQLGSIIKGN